MKDIAYKQAEEFLTGMGYMNQDIGGMSLCGDRAQVSVAIFLCILSISCCMPGTVQEQIDRSGREFCLVAEASDLYPDPKLGFEGLDLYWPDGGHRQM